MIDFYRKDLTERCQRRPRFHLHPVALGDSAGTAEFFVTHDRFGSSMLDRGYGPQTPLLGEIIEYLKQKAFILVETGEKLYGERGRLYSIDAFFFSDKSSQRFVLPQDR